MIPIIGQCDVTYQDQTYRRMLLFHIFTPFWLKSGPRFNIKRISYQYRNSHCGYKKILRPSYLHNGISYTGKMTSLYWIIYENGILEYKLAQIIHWERELGLPNFSTAVVIHTMIWTSRKLVNHIKVGCKMAHGVPFYIDVKANGFILYYYYFSIFREYMYIFIWFSIESVCWRSLKFLLNIIIVGWIFWVHFPLAMPLCSHFHYVLIRRFIWPGYT